MRPGARDVFAREKDVDPEDLRLERESPGTEPALVPVQCGGCRGDVARREGVPRCLEGPHFVAERVGRRDHWSGPIRYRRLDGLPTVRRP